MIYLGLADGDEHYEPEAKSAHSRNEDYSVDYDRDERRSEPAPAPRSVPSEEYRAPVTPIKRVQSSHDNSAALRQITTVHPRFSTRAEAVQLSAPADPIRP
jgi:cell division inhibitor SepF